MHQLSRVRTVESALFLGGLLVLASMPLLLEPVSAQQSAAGTVQTRSGLHTVSFATVQGKVYVNLPTAMVAGDTITGTVTAEPAGANEPERQKNLGELNGYVVEVENRPTQVSEGKGKWLVAAWEEAEKTVALLPVLLRAADGTVLGRVSLPTFSRQTVPGAIAQEVAGQGMIVPSLAQGGRPLEILGQFDGDFASTGVRIGGKEAQLLAESPRQLVVESPADVAGVTDIEVKEGDQVAKTQLRCVGVELTAKKVHRGMEGLALRGLHTGGRVFGYNTVAVEGGKRLEVHEAEAAIVRRIFELSASGFSLKAIAKKLNAEGIPPPRPRAGKRFATWCPTAIQPMLRRELYIGKIVWNKSKFVKVPGSNKRLRRHRPQSEWRAVERPELRIVSDELWQKVQQRLAWVKEQYSSHHREGLLNRAASSRYLLSGFLKCGVCGANLVIVAGRNRRGHPKYGCPQHHSRGTCLNSLIERQDWLEKRLLGELQEAVLQPEAVNYAIEEFGRQLKARLADLSGELARMRERKEQLEKEIRHYVAAIGEHGHSKFLLDAIAERERELDGITARLLSEGPDSIEANLEEIRRFVTERLAKLHELLYGDVACARAELAKHVTQIRMIPQEAGGERYYVAAGEWNLLGGYPETGRARHLPGVRARLVAGVGFEPTTFGL